MTHKKTLIMFNLLKKLFKVKEKTVKVSDIVAYAKHQPLYNNVLLISALLDRLGHSEASYEIEEHFKNYTTFIVKNYGTMIGEINLPDSSQLDNSDNHED